MSRAEEIDAIQQINTGLWAAAQSDASPLAEFRGRPLMRVFSIDPWQAQRYGRLANRPPELNGDFPILALAYCANNRGGLYVRPVVSAGLNEMYALRTPEPKYILELAQLVGVELEITGSQ